MTKIETKNLSVRANELDVLNFLDVLGESDVLRGNVDATGEKLSSVKELANDLFDSMFQYEPSLKDVGEVGAGFRHNRGFVERAMGTEEYERLRNFTKVNDVESAIATATVLKNIFQNLSNEDLENLERQSAEHKSLDDELGALEDRIMGLQGVLEQNTNESLVGELNNAMEQKSMLESQLSKIEGSLQETVDGLGTAIRVSVRKGMQEAHDDIEEVYDLCGGWGTGMGDARKIDPKIKLLMAEKLKNNEKLKRIARAIGKLKRIAVSKRQKKVQKIPEEIVDITMGDNIANILPSETALLDDSDLEWIFLRNLCEKRLLQYELEGNDNVGMGAIVCAIDCSCSMMGDREIWAKAIVGGMLEVAGKEKRDFAVVFFGSKDQFTTFKIPYSMQGGERLLKVIEIMEFFFGGGTDFETPIDEARRIIESKGKWHKADILIVTDGECGVGDEWLVDLKGWKKDHDVKIQGILIGRPTEVMHKFCDLTYTIVDLLDEKVNGNMYDLYGYVN